MATGAEPAKVPTRRFRKFRLQGFGSFHKLSSIFRVIVDDELNKRSFLRVLGYRFMPDCSKPRLPETLNLKTSGLHAIHEATARGAKWILPRMDGPCLVFRGDRVRLGDFCERP